MQFMNFIINVTIFQIATINNIFILFLVANAEPFCRNMTQPSHSDDVICPWVTTFCTDYSISQMSYQNMTCLPANRYDNCNGRIECHAVWTTKQFRGRNNLYTSIRVVKACVAVLRNV